MLFNSFEFAIFLPVVFVLYWFVTNKSLKLQNSLIVVSSYLFYGWWDWRFLLLIFFSTLVDYLVGNALSKIEKTLERKILLWISVFVNIGTLGFFKYFDFFIENFQQAFSFFGSELNLSSLNIILPVGISFYTFQTLSYTIDVYKKKIVATNDFISFCAFVSFFPQLVAGPIERATNLLPQFTSKRKFDYHEASDGMRQILWGLFKKIVVADNCAELTNQIFGSYQIQSGSVLILGAIFFAFQIYGDFSGYSDIAIGTAKLFGITLMRNFNNPYFSRDIAEFWRRWHISLTTWFRDYIYIPMGGSKTSKANIIRNTLIIFLVSGFWHGANWTFVVWGLYHALLFLPLILLNKNRKNINLIAENKVLPHFKEFIQIISTFVLVGFGWIFFRSENIQQAFDYMWKIFNYDKDYFNFTTIKIGQTALSNYTIIFAALSIFILILVEWMNRNKRFGLDISHTKYRGIIYAVLCVVIYLCKGGDAAFIYFQF